MDFLIENTAEISPPEKQRRVDKQKRGECCVKRIVGSGVDVKSILLRHIQKETTPDWARTTISKGGRSHAGAQVGCPLPESSRGKSQNA